MSEAQPSRAPDRGLHVDAAGRVTVTSRGGEVRVVADLGSRWRYVRDDEEELVVAAARRPPRGNAPTASAATGRVPPPAEAPAAARTDPVTPPAAPGGPVLAPTFQPPAV